MQITDNISLMNDYSRRCIMKDDVFNMISFVSALLIGLFSVTTVSARSFSTGKNTTWVPVDESDWAVYMAAPAYHFNCAKEYLQKGDGNSALAELKRGEAFLSFQKNKLSAALSEMEKLRKNIQSRKEYDTLGFNLAVTFALNTVDHKYRMLPVNVNGGSMFGSAHEYHLAKARDSMAKKNITVTAEELRQASAFLKLKAASMGITPWSGVISAGEELEQLAKKVESGNVKNVKEFDAIYAKATSIFGKAGK
jgi:hypothetical protein